MSHSIANLDHLLNFDPSLDIPAFLLQAPAKSAVYLLADEADRPLQLLCVKNLRHSLKRRLGADPEVAASKRLDYRQIVRRVYFRRVDSAVEADLVYYQSARRLFPESYQAMLGFHPAWYLHVDPDSDFPRYVKTTDLSPRPGQFIGPIADKHAAARLIELIQDIFDLCRYYHILLESPHGKACAYKEMGKCPAPCDGSITIGQYRRLIYWSTEVLVDPKPMIAEQSERMAQAAAALQFESAARIKSFISQLSLLGQGAFRHARLLEDFRFVSLQRGPYAGSAKVFLILPGRIEILCCLLSAPTSAADLVRLIHQAAAEIPAAPIDRTAADQLAIVAHHLFSPKNSQGVFIPVAQLDESAILRAYKNLRKQKIPEPEEAEGVIKELQAIPEA